MNDGAFWAVHCKEDRTFNSLNHAYIFYYLERCLFEYVTCNILSNHLTRFLAQATDKPARGLR